MLSERLVSLAENETEARMRRMAEGFLEKGQRLAVWGAGNTGQRAMKYLREIAGDAWMPQCIVDNNPSLWGGKTE